MSKVIHTVKGYLARHKESGHIDVTFQWPRSTPHLNLHDEYENVAITITYTVEDADNER